MNHGSERLKMAIREFKMQQAKSLPYPESAFNEGGEIKDYAGPFDFYLKESVARVRYATIYQSS